MAHLSQRVLSQCKLARLPTCNRRIASLDSACSAFALDSALAAAPLRQRRDYDVSRPGGRQPHAATLPSVAPAQVIHCGCLFPRLVQPLAPFWGHSMGVVLGPASHRSHKPALYLLVDRPAAAVAVAAGGRGGGGLSRLAGSPAHRRDIPIVYVAAEVRAHPLLLEEQPAQPRKERHA